MTRSNGGDRNIMRILSQLMSALGSLGIVAMVILINADVGLRSVVGIPVPAVEQIISVSIVAIVFLQLPDCIHVGRMISSDILVTNLKGRPRSLLDTLCSMLGMAVMGAIVWFVVPEIVEAYSERQRIGVYGVFQIPRWPFLLAVAAGAGLATAEYVRILWSNVRDLISGPDEDMQNGPERSDA